MTELDNQKKISSSSMLPWLLRIRNLLAICLIITTIFIVVYSYISIKGVIEFTVNSATQTASNVASILRDKSLRTAREQLATEADSKAHQIGKELEKAVTAITTLAEVLSGMVEEQVVVDVGRDVVNGMLHSILHDNTRIFGVYTVWEPDSFDMLDLAYAGSALHDNTGRFIPYWYRNTDNKVIGKPCEDYDNQNTDQKGVKNGSFYLLPKKTRQIHIIGPRRIVIDKNDVLIISIVAPIIVENKFLGITGIDLNLDFLQKIIKETSSNLLQKQGKLMVLNHGGFIVVSNTSNGEIGQSLKSVLIKHSKRKTMEEEVIIYTPIIIDRFLTPWSIRMAIPLKILKSDSDAIYKTMMADTNATSETLNRQGMSALWKLVVSGILLVISALSISVLIKILDRKESALIKSEKKFRETNIQLQNSIESMPAAYILWNTNNQVVEWNKAAENIFGYLKE
ncbi:MAG: PAS domain-containing protein, partial [Desulfobacula sp.]|nr:PAS domain-containing protein [Desulfobacula sp.]